MKTKRNSIVFINQSTGYLMVDIVNHLSIKYDHAVLLAGDIAIREKSLQPGIKQISICKYNRKNNLTRFLTWGIATFQSWYLITFKYRKSDLFLVSNPPLNILLPLWRKTPYSFLIYDVYPDIFLTSKLLSEKNLVYKFWQRINRKVFRNARYIYTITDGLYSALAKYAETDKIKVVPIWTTNNFLKPLDKASNPLIKELNLVGKFIVMYSGNFGKTHPVECLLDVARLCKSPDIHFLFVGAGDKFDTIKRSIIEEKLENCSAYSLFSVELLPLSLAMPDIGIVTLEDSASEVSIPSKTFSLMSTATPILAITKCTSSLAAMIDKYEIGCHHSSDEINDILKTILDLYQDKEKISIYRINSLKASKDFTADNVKKFTI